MDAEREGTDRSVLTLTMELSVRRVKSVDDQMSFWARSLTIGYPQQPIKLIFDHRRFLPTQIGNKHDVDDRLENQRVAMEDIR